jgi:hypothetical protein
MNLQEEIEHFVQAWGPDAKDLRHSFIIKLRELLNNYAAAAIEHGNLPEVGRPHRETRRTTPGVAEP